MQSTVPASKKILFISDVHLGAFSKEKNSRVEKDLIELINFAQSNDYRIAILGDLFDYWIEYPHFTPALSKKLLQQFKEFNQHQQESTLYVTGNHDYWTLGHFKKCGFDVEPDYRILHINGQQILLLHGDATSSDLQHLERPIFHQLLRNKTFLKIYRTVLPARFGLRLMQYVSKVSNLFDSVEDDPKPLNKWAKRMLKNSDINYIICGHDHLPRCLKYDFGTYLNLGTFHTHKSLVMYNNRAFKLVKWNSDEQELIPFSKPST